jgi:hypothetical protein
MVPDDFPSAGAVSDAAADGAARHGEQYGEGTPVDFGWGEDRKLTGRRKKAEISKKAKPGSFGKSPNNRLRRRSAPRSKSLLLKTLQSVH